MPLRDHFHPTLEDLAPREGFHGQWPAMIVLALSRLLPRRYAALPNIHFGPSVEIDVGTDEQEGRETAISGNDPGNGGGIATAFWAPSRPTLSLATDFPSQDEYEIRVYDRKVGRRLVAAIEIVSPANKDRPEHRRAFVARCAALLQQRVSVTIIDLVTTRHFNLYSELLAFMDKEDPAFSGEDPFLYGAACRATKKDDAWLVEIWAHRLTLGQPLPTLPLWLADNLALPLELETSSEETCRALRIP